MLGLRKSAFNGAQFRFIVAAFIAVLALVASHAPASLITYSTMSGASTGGKSVNARATFTVSNNQIVVTLENLQSNPSNVVQLLSGVEFHVSTGQKTGTLLSSSATARTVSSNGTFSDGSTVTSGWKLSTAGSDLFLNLLGQPIAPDHMLIGPDNGLGKYSKADSSILTGHNPFLAKSATFTLTVPGVTSNSKVTSTTFQFNSCTGNCVTGCQTSPVPEPTAAAMGLIAFATIAMKRKR